MMVTKKMTRTNLPIMVKKLHDSAVLPQQNEGNVGFDLTSIQDMTIPAGCTAAISTGLLLAETVEPLIQDDKIVAVPFLKVEGRSGMASRGVFPVGGIIDPNYRGELKVMLHNSSDVNYCVYTGDRVAQLVCYLTFANLGGMQVKFLFTDEVSPTDRGDKGFGSTGT